MTWFTHYTRPARRGLAPGGRNHVRSGGSRTLCGVALPPWLVSRAVICDPLTGSRAYPDCKRCARMARRRAAAPPARLAETLVPAAA